MTSATVTTDAKIAAVRAHALRCYNRGWDVIVDAYTDQEIADLTKSARSGRGAIGIMAWEVFEHKRVVREAREQADGIDARLDRSWARYQGLA